MSGSGLDVVSLLPQDARFESVIDLITRAASQLRVSQEQTLVGVRRRLRHGRCDILLVANDETGMAALDDTALRGTTVVIPVLSETPPPDQREATRQTFRARGAFVLLFAEELTLALLECVVDAACATAPQPVGASATSSTMAQMSASRSARGTLSELNVARELLSSSLRHLLAADEGARPFTLFVLALDRYQVISDSLLTDGTSSLLHAVTERLKYTVGSGDMVAYLGGGRFAVLAQGSVGPELGEKLGNAFAVPVDVAGEPLYLQAAIGMTHSTRKYDTPEDVIRDGITATRQTDAARNPATFKTSMRMEEAEEIRLEAELRRAVMNREFSLNYQPIVRVDSGEPIGFEALLRWTSPTRGRMSPAQFIPVLERTDLIIELGAWILEQAARQAAEWIEEFDLASRLLMSVNVSAKQLPRPELVGDVETALRNTGIDPRALKLEFTETATMEKPDEVADVLRRCKALGVDVWVDDFGTGYSSLAHIRRFPVDGLKLDKAFIDPLDGSSDGSTIARAVLGVANIIGASVVAEGIESAAQAAELTQLGCVWGQGYHFSRPLSVADAYAYIARSFGAE